MKHLKLSERAIESVPDYCVYRFYDRSGILLYIGMTICLVQRLCAHQDDKDWFPEVSRIEIEYFPDKDSAAEAEKNAIRKLDPLYNVALKRADGVKPPRSGVRPPDRRWNRCERPGCDDGRATDRWGELRVCRDCRWNLQHEERMAAVRARRAAAAQIIESDRQSLDSDQGFLVECVSSRLTSDAVLLLVAILANADDAGMWCCALTDMAKRVGWFSDNEWATPQEHRIAKPMGELIRGRLVEKRKRVGKNPCTYVLL